jgi:hypothetical protein
VKSAATSGTVAVDGAIARNQKHGKRLIQTKVNTANAVNVDAIISQEEMANVLLIHEFWDVFKLMKDLRNFFQRSPNIYKHSNVLM